MADESQERWRDHARTPRDRAVGAPTVTVTKPEPRPVVTVDPRVRFGRPQINGISVEAIAELVIAGEDIDTVLKQWGITRPQLLVACWYVAVYGPPRHRHMWREWLAAAEGPLAHGHYTEIPDPPSKEEVTA